MAIELRTRLVLITELKRAMVVATVGDDRSENIAHFHITDLDHCKPTACECDVQVLNSYHRFV